MRGQKRHLCAGARALSMSESPFQMTPSQSKMKTSVLSRRSDGTVSLVQRPFACELDEIERVCEL